MLKEGLVAHGGEESNDDEEEDGNRVSIKARQQSSDG